MDPTTLGTIILVGILVVSEVCCKKRESDLKAELKAKAQHRRAHGG